MAQFDGITLGELARNLQSFEIRVNKKFDDLAYVPRGEYEQRLGNLEKEIGEINERLRWASRAMIMAVVMTPLSVAITTWMVAR
jgi:hypothetical protein